MFTQTIVLICCIFLIVVYNFILHCLFFSFFLWFGLHLIFNFSLSKKLFLQFKFYFCGVFFHPPLSIHFKIEFYFLRKSFSLSLYWRQSITIWLTKVDRGLEKTFLGLVLKQTYPIREKNKIGYTGGFATPHPPPPKHNVKRAKVRKLKWIITEDMMSKRKITMCQIQVRHRRIW